MDAEPPPLAHGDALLIDFDGTLTELADSPDAVTVPAGLHVLLNDLHTLLDGALAVITGRTLESLDRHLGPSAFPAAGIHGSQLRLAGGQVVNAPQVLEGVASQLRQAFDSRSGILVEDKGAAVAVHFRHAPHLAQDVEHALLELVRHADVSIVHGKLVVEARPRAADKGTALRQLLCHPPFAGRLPVFAGDDTADEDAFAVAQELGGHGIKVGAGDSVARFHLPGPGAVHNWLQRSREHLGKDPGKSPECSPRDSGGAGR